MKTLDLLKRILPEIEEIIERRYLILRGILYSQPIGRRSLSAQLNIKERAIREEVNILKGQGLLEVDIMGMNLTEDGKNILDKLDLIYGYIRGIPELEEKLSKTLNIKNALIIPGSSNDNSMILKDMGKATSKILKEYIRHEDIIGITGGSTMAAFVEEVVIDNKKRDITVIPARGGLGREVETQSNSIAAKLAQKLGGSYRLLYAPDGLEEKALEIILQNEEIKELMEMISNMNILIFGIGRADTMAKRRNLSEEKIQSLIDNGAVAEAFGHYFNIEGKEVWEYKTIGLSLKKYKSLDRVMAVAGGEEKAEAIISVSALNSNMILITDELAARKILTLVN